MAGFNEKRVTDGINYGGIVELGNGLMSYSGSGVFTTTGTTVVINHPFGTGDIFSAQVTPLVASYSANDLCTFQSGTSANQLKVPDSTTGVVKAVTTGKATIQRNSSGTSGLAFTVFMVGRARH